MKNIYYKLFLLLVQFCVCYILYLTFISFRYQYRIINDTKTSELSFSIDEIEKMPSIPNVGVTTLPVSALKAPYYIKSDNKRAYKLLKNGYNENPYINYSEYLLATYHFQVKAFDSAKFYAAKAFYNWPKNLDHYKLYNKTLVATKDTLEILKAYDFINSTFLEKEGYYKDFIDSYSNARLRYLIYEYKDLKTVNPDSLLGKWREMYEFETGDIYFLDNYIEFDKSFFISNDNKYKYELQNDTLVLSFATNNQIISKFPIFYSDSLGTLIFKNLDQLTVEVSKKRDKFYKKID